MKAFGPLDTLLLINSIVSPSPQLQQLVASLSKSVADTSRPSPASDWFRRPHSAIDKHAHAQRSRLIAAAAGARRDEVNSVPPRRDRNGALKGTEAGREIIGVDAHLVEQQHRALTIAPRAVRLALHPNAVHDVLDDRRPLAVHPHTRPSIGSLKNVLNWHSNKGLDAEVTARLSDSHWHRDQCPIRLDLNMKHRWRRPAGASSACSKIPGCAVLVSSLVAVLFSPTMRRSADSPIAQAPRQAYAVDRAAAENWGKSDAEEPSAVTPRHRVHQMLAEGEAQNRLRRHLDSKPNVAPSLPEVDIPVAARRDRRRLSRRSVERELR